MLLLVALVGKTGVVEELVVTYGVVLLLLEVVETPVVLDELVVATEDVLLLLLVVGESRRGS